MYCMLDIVTACWCAKGLSAPTTTANNIYFVADCKTPGMPMVVLPVHSFQATIMVAIVTVQWMMDGRQHVGERNVTGIWENL